MKAKRLHPTKLVLFLQKRLDKLGLRARITIAFALTGLLLATITTLTTLGLTRQSLLETRKSTTFAAFINNSRRVLNELTLETDDEGRRAIIERLGQTSGTFPLLLAGEDWTAADPLVFGSELVPPSLLDLANTGVPARIRTRIGSSTMIVSALPITRAGINAIYFEAARLNDIEDTLETLARILFGVAVISTLLSAFLGSWASQKVLKPLVQVRTAAEALSSGALDTRLNPPGDADLASLAASFNDMARSLEDRIAHEVRFTSAVSHELRSPLMTLTASMEVLTNSSGQLDRPGRVALGLLEDDMTRFSQLLEDLVEINRYDIGIADLQPEPIDIAEFVQKVIPQYNNVDLRFIIQPGIKAIIIRADKRRLQQVLVNLLNNAISYGNGKVTVGLDQQGDLLQLSVEDNGPGVPAEEYEKIFGRFTRGRAGSNRGNSSGTGLGLSLVAEHVSLHQGRVWVEDRPDDTPGARFVVELPITSENIETHNHNVNHH